VAKREASNTGPSSATNNFLPVPTRELEGFSYLRRFSSAIGAGSWPGRLPERGSIKHRSSSYRFIAPFSSRKLSFRFRREVAGNRQLILDSAETSQ
jgi:hypothetical protein